MNPPDYSPPLHPRAETSNGGGHGGGHGGNGEIRARLRALEIQTGRIEERMKSMATRMATQDDISKLKIWILGGLLSAFFAGAVAVAVSAMRGWMMTAP